MAPKHAAHDRQRLARSFADPDVTLLEPREIDGLETLRIAGKDVAQICCNNGRELICVKRMGAGRCVGFEGAEAVVEQARELAAA